ncbi:hypothetical protein GCM10022243_30770 [Saccharothrix violaceirubra]|uniref:Uncharacterized protein n=1 Tax=Saccharothrix violaceirubra TaxID=413306 RepID=A0A7W7T505_9PSEU|nr:hypothetical protein [Saccharothrix violaceirubra]MBB4966703.1 hypothetical protein [Saccharothrix violaceirubra]
MNSASAIDMNTWIKIGKESYPEFTVSGADIEVSFSGRQLDLVFSESALRAFVAKAAEALDGIDRAGSLSVV